ncbi:GspH/FimT family pseudopilin [Hydrogenophaga sp. 2FB]|uniref:GspH/FimT family pseudopilin n=1 Tax=Hydrogenophaga sp. 2FB TaxID=2502187 RepID=UPI001BB163AB|nr:GspH/FimT family pseudopilin [Hydrogenophaga sp. 2FB]
MHGFTLVELMVTLVLAALLTMIAVPSFTNQLRGWQRDSATKAFTAHVQLARSTSIKTSRRVVMCSSTNGTTCRNSNQWHMGWLVYVDINNSGDLDANDNVLATRGASTGLSTMQTSVGVRQLTFMPNGLMASNATTLSVIPASRTLKMNEVVLNRVGRPYIRSTDQPQKA